MNRRALVVAILLLAPFVAAYHAVTPLTAADRTARGTSLVSLLGSPGQYHGQVVRVVGVALIEFEANGLYLCREHLDSRVTKNAVWMVLDFEAIGKTEAELAAFNGQYVLVEGTFNKDNHGPLGLQSGAIEQITRFMPWQVHSSQ